jgi:periplasmic protein TonB
MPADLFRPNVVATSRRRRASLLPVSIAGHIVAIAACLIVPLLAAVELPPPNQRVTSPYIQVMPIAPPVTMRHDTTPTKQVSNPASVLAPVIAPPDVMREPEFPTFESTVPGAAFGSSTGVDAAGLIEGAGVAPAPALSPSPPKPVHVGGLIQPPRKIVNVPPAYPAIAQSSHVQGKVVLEALIGVDGHVNHVRVLEPVPLLTDAAISAVRQWVFTPTKLNGEPVQVIMTVTVDFKLQ